MQPEATTTPEHAGHFVVRLIKGELGLVRTYWLFGVLGGVICRVLLIAMPTPDLFLIAVALTIFYQATVLVGIWNAATRYAGPKRWSILAKVACVLGGLMLIKNVVTVF